MSDTSPNYSITVWSSDNYFSEGDHVEVHMNTRRRPRGISGVITNTEIRDGKRMHEVKGHWYPERDLRPKINSSDNSEENDDKPGVHVAPVLLIIILLVLIISYLIISYI